MMKTPHNPLKIINFVAAILLPLLGSSLALAQNAQQGSASPQATITPKCHHEHRGWKNLSESEREQLKVDMKAIHQNPQLVAAREAVKAAQTPEAKTSARITLRQIRHDLLVKADPSIEPVLAKLKQGHSDKDE